MIRVEGALQHDGHGVDDGARRRGARHVVPGVAGTPAPDARLLEAAHETGRLAVQLVADDRRPSTFLTKASFHNAIVALAAIGGSTNAVVHLLAIAGRLGIDLTIDDFDRIGAEVPLLVNLQPAGRYLMDDLYRAGGFLAVLREVRDLLDPDRADASRAGRSWTYLDDAQIWDADVITPRDAPLLPARASACCAASLAPGRRAHQTGRRVTAPPEAPRPRGRVRLDRGLPRPHRRPRPRHRREQRHGSPRLRPEGLPRHARGVEHAAASEAPRAGRARHGAHLRRAHERARRTAPSMLHVTPEAAAGGPLALVQTGDWISLDVRAAGSISTSRRTSSRRERRTRRRWTATPTPPRVGAALRRPRPAGRPGRRPRLPSGLLRIGGVA